MLDSGRSMGTLCNFPQPRYWTLGLLPPSQSWMGFSRLTTGATQNGRERFVVVKSREAVSCCRRVSKTPSEKSKSENASVVLRTAKGNHLAAICDGDFTQRKPRWFVPVFTSPLPRVPTMYREQYCSLQRNEPPRWTRFFSLGSAGSNGESGPCGLRATPPLSASVS